MNKFLGVPDAKQKAVVDAALAVFGANGYKKASVSDIASAAGISKAMVFHYFGSKKQLYLYLAELCIADIKAAVIEKFDKSTTDFFDRIRLAAAIKTTAMKKHPSLITFLGSMYRETDEEVAVQLKEILIREKDFGRHFILEDMDTAKFKDNTDPKLVMKMLVWLSEGYISSISVQTETDIDAMTREFGDCLDLLKNNLYKERYL